MNTYFVEQLQTSAAVWNVPQENFTMRQLLAIGIINSRENMIWT